MRIELFCPVLHSHVWSFQLYDGIHFVLCWILCCGDGTSVSPGLLGPIVSFFNVVLLCIWISMSSEEGSDGVQMCF